MGSFITKVTPTQTPRDTESMLSQAKEFAERTLRERLPSDLLFHSADHTLRDVFPACDVLASRLGIHGDDLLCLRTAALFHDIGYVDQYAKNEPVGCSWAEKHLPGFGYTPSQVALVKEIIMATQMPQSPRGVLQEIMCDADLSHLGTGEFFTRTELLRREVGLHCEPPKEIDEVAWAKGNIKFLEEHKYFTAPARELYAQVQERNLQLTREIVAKAESTAAQKSPTAQ